MGVVLWVVVLVGAITSSLVASIFLAAGLQTIFHRAQGALISLNAEGEEFEMWKATLQKLDATVAISLWLSTLFYGIAIYLVWGI